MRSIVYILNEMEQKTMKDCIQIKLFIRIVYTQLSSRKYIKALSTIMYVLHKENLIIIVE